MSDHMDEVRGFLDLTDDVPLFATTTAGEPIDGEVVLITAYLARELSLAQIAAVEERLATDPSFRAAVQPIIDTWVLPGLFVRSAGASGGVHGSSSPVLTAAQLDAGWRRHLAASSSSARQMRSLARLAAVIAVIVLPLAGFAQVVTYVARHDEGPAGNIARKVVRLVIGGASTSVPDTTRAANVAQPVLGRVDSSASACAGCAAERADPPAHDGVNRSQPQQPRPSVPFARVIGPQTVATHDLGPVLATSSLTFPGEVQLASLGAGRVLVADPQSLRVQLLDSSLSRATVVVDSTDEPRYSATKGYIIPYRGDSALMMDNNPRHGGAVIITPDGRIGRTMAIGGGVLGGAMTGPLSFRGTTASRTLGLFLRSETKTRWEFVDQSPGQPDRAFPITYVLWRMPDARQIDSIDVEDGGGWRVVRNLSVHEFHDFGLFDEAVATTDGAVAIFHAREYRIEWILPDGTRPPPSQPMPYPWKKITDDLRRHILDSINGGLLRAHDSAVAERAADSARTGSPPMITRTVPPVNLGGRGLNASTIRAAVTERVPAPPLPAPFLFPAQAIPDYYPPTTGRSQVLADADNNVWIRAAALTAPDGAGVWEVVNRAQGVIDRVRVPANQTIVGFGRGGIVYVVVRDAGVGRIEKVRVR